jgi:fatty acid desaturase
MSSNLTDFEQEMEDPNSSSRSRALRFPPTVHPLPETVELPGRATSSFAVGEFGPVSQRETGMLGYDLMGLVVLVLVVWALIGILGSGAPPVEKLIWVIVVLVMPLIGFVLWYLLGPGGKSFPLRRR